MSIRRPLREELVMVWQPGGLGNPCYFPQFPEQILLPRGQLRLIEGLHILVYLVEAEHPAQGGVRLQVPN